MTAPLFTQSSSALTSTASRKNSTGYKYEQDGMEAGHLTCCTLCTAIKMDPELTGELGVTGAVFSQKGRLNFIHLVVLYAFKTFSKKCC